MKKGLKGVQSRRKKIQQEEVKVEREVVITNNDLLASPTYIMNSVQRGFSMYDHSLFMYAGACAKFFKDNYSMIESISTDNPSPAEKLRVAQYIERQISIQRYFDGVILKELAVAQVYSLLYPEQDTVDYALSVGPCVDLYNKELIDETLEEISDSRSTKNFYLNVRKELLVPVMCTIAKSKNMVDLFNCFDVEVFSAFANVANNKDKSTLNKRMEDHFYQYKEIYTSDIFWNSVFSEISKRVDALSEGEYQSKIAWAKMLSKLSYSVYHPAKEAYYDVLIDSLEEAVYTTPKLRDFGPSLYLDLSYADRIKQDEILDLMEKLSKKTNTVVLVLKSFSKKIDVEGTVVSGQDAKTLLVEYALLYFDNVFVEANMSNYPIMQTQVYEVASYAINYRTQHIIYQISVNSEDDDGTARPSVFDTASLVNQANEALRYQRRALDFILDQDRNLAKHYIQLTKNSEYWIAEDQEITILNSDKKRVATPGDEGKISSILQLAKRKRDETKVSFFDSDSEEGDSFFAVDMEEEEESEDGVDDITNLLLRLDNSVTAEMLIQLELDPSNALVKGHLLSLVGDDRYSSILENFQAQLTEKTG
jgi:hypothetical protein